MKNFRRDFERFCYRHQSKGIPNLMLYISIGTAIVWLFSTFDPSNLLTAVLRFDRSAILHGQIWRLLSYVFIPSSGGVLFLADELCRVYVYGDEAYVTAPLLAKLGIDCLLVGDTPVIHQ